MEQRLDDSSRNLGSVDRPAPVMGDDGIDSNEIFADNQ